MPSLLLGCGHSRVKKIWMPGQEKWSEPLTTLDMGTDCGADIVWDLENRPLPVPDEHFDEIAAYDVLEHIGKQGDWRGFFDEFAEYWRILKMGGTFGIVVPCGNDWFADPGHTRFFTSTWFVFLDRDQISQNLAKGTQMTDYRWYWKRNFAIRHIDTAKSDDGQPHHIFVMLQKTA
jgi:SAM-dependent methyltransferase